MGDRYWITGVQIGLLKTVDKNQREQILQSIFDNQFIANFPTDRDKEWFEKTIKILQELR